MKYRFIFTFVTCLAFASLSAQLAIPPDTLVNRLLTQTRLFPQESLYVHTDKSDYVAGDTVWFRAYTINAISRKPENLSRYVYAELIGAQADTVVYRVRTRKDTLGRIYGHIPLPPSLPKGTYHFRAYTHYTRNWGEDGFFAKPIRIYAMRPTEKQEKKLPPTDYQVDFLPEGGQAIGGQPCRIAFKAQNQQGTGEHIRGVVTDEQGDTLARFGTLHNGMGEFTLALASGKRYVARCINNRGQEKHFDLPRAMSRAAALKVTMSQQECSVSVVHDSLFDTESMQLVVLQRGHPHFAKPWDKRKETLIFPQQLFDTGVVHFLLLGTGGKIESERLVFVNHPEESVLTLSTDCTQYAPRQRVNATIELTDGQNRPLEGSCSISVTDVTDVPMDESTHILSALLLTADVKGAIEAPGWYFGKVADPERIHALDLLMRIHGWRRYDLQAVIYGQYVRPTQLPEGSMQLSGEVKTSMNRATKNTPVQVYVQGQAMMTEVKTDEYGRFEVSGFEFPDSVRYLVTALSHKGKENVVLKMRPESYPTIVPLPHTHFAEKRDNEADAITKEQKYVHKSLQNIGYSKGMRHYLLGEVNITAQVKKEYQTDFERDANVIIREERIRKSGLPNVQTVLAALGGIYPNSPKQITFALDGVAIEALPSSDPEISNSPLKWLLHTFNVDDIGQIDIIKSPLAVGYFQGRQDVVVAISTKRGGKQYNSLFTNSNMSVWTPLGYQQPIEKYAPRYDLPNPNSNKPDMRTTLHWQPNLTVCNGKASFAFYTADSPSSYHIVVEGVSTDGKVFRKVQRLF